MSGDEIFVLCLSGFIVLVTWANWLWCGVSVRNYHHSRTPHRAVAAAAGGAIVLLAAVLKFWASWDVRGDLVYLLFYQIMGGAIVALTLLLLGWTGLSLRDDVIERFNPAAGIALSGAIIGSTLAFAGANIGDGPGWWVVVFCALLSNGSLLAGWALLNAAAPVSDAITIDRDSATAWRTAGWFIGGGLIFGRGAAGNWKGPGPAVTDFLQVALGGAVLLLLAAAAEVLFRRTSAGRSPWLGGMLQAGLYACFAIAFVRLAHPW